MWVVRWAEEARTDNARAYGRPDQLDAEITKPNRPIKRRPHLRPTLPTRALLAPRHSLRTRLPKRAERTDLSQIGFVRVRRSFLKQRFDYGATPRICSI